MRSLRRLRNKRRIRFGEREKIAAGLDVRQRKGMKKIPLFRTSVLLRLFLPVLVTLLAPAPAGAQGSSLPPAVAKALSQAGIPESAVGIYVQEIGADRPLVAVGAERAMNPASTIKLLTTYAALELLGPAYFWQTEAYAAGTLSQDVLTGDLVLKGYGDPKLTLENFWLLLRDLRGRGLREIRGDLVLDRSYFATGTYDPAQFDEQPTRPYNTGPDALLVNFKAVRLQFVPDAEARTVRIVMEPALPQVQIVNQLVLDSAPCGDWVTRLKLDAQGAANAARFQFAGHYARDCGERARNFSVLSHQQYVLALFTQLWRELGGVFAGGVREGAGTRDARLIASLQSPALAEIVRDINKYSNNVMARQLFLTLAAELVGTPAKAENATLAIRQWLTLKNIRAPELVLENGSGLSRDERISAGNMAAILQAA
ncbi:MAG TPA: D-alanyl-D-alanine carboxypeptidase/D-alanyl-D-alanine-endopeptidase, partial [Burkholderiales bacterium]|nr:D-alanyl-D-alanine carboxypeptidase/D-alanyl-D-alanine-endopeptidase [Burkholderiales bacterium]